MLLARQVVLDGHHLDDHRHGDEGTGEPRAITPAHEHRQPHHGRRRPGVDDVLVRVGQPDGAHRADPDADPGVHGPGERGDVGDHQRLPPAHTDLRDPEDHQDLRQRPPHRKVQRRYEQRQRGAQQRHPQMLIGLYGADVLDRPIAPGLVLHELERQGQTHRGECQRNRPQPVRDQRGAHRPQERAPLGTREATQGGCLPPPRRGYLPPPWHRPLPPPWHRPLPPPWHRPLPPPWHRPLPPPRHRSLPPPRPSRAHLTFSRCLRFSHLGRPGASRKPSARPAAIPMRSKSVLFSKSMYRGSQIGRYFALAR